MSPLLLLGFSGILRAQTWWLADTVLRNWVELTLHHSLSDRAVLSAVFRMYESPDPSYGSSFLGLFRGNLDLITPAGRVTLGDVEETWGLGLVFFPVYEPETRREQFLRGVFWSAPGDHLILAVGQPLSWTFFTPDGDTALRMGLVGFRGAPGGVALQVLRDPHRRRDRQSLDGYLRFSYGTLYVQGEALWARGYDPLLLQDTSGFGLYGRVEWGWGVHTFRLEGKWYEGMDLLLAFPPPANHLGILPSNARSEAGVSLSLEGAAGSLLYTLTGSGGWDPWKPDSLNFREGYVSLEGRSGAVGWRLEGMTYAWGDALRVIGKTHRKETRFQGEFLWRDWIASVVPRWVDDGHPWREILLSLAMAPRPWKIESGLILSDSLSGWLTVSLVPSEPWSLSLRIGNVRGDLICAGGVCRYEPPFQGLDLTLEVQF